MSHAYAYLKRLWEGSKIWSTGVAKGGKTKTKIQDVSTEGWLLANTAGQNAQRSLVGDRVPEIGLQYLQWITPPSLCMEGYGSLKVQTSEFGEEIRRRQRIRAKPVNYRQRLRFEFVNCCGCNLGYVQVVGGGIVNISQSAIYTLLQRINS